MTGSFVHLHHHTEYSLLDGESRILDGKKPGALPKAAAQMGMPALAMTDHGNLYGAVEFYRACREVGVKPILGCEVYVARGSRLERAGGSEAYFHLTLLAENDLGWRNLMKLISAGFIEGFHAKPRIDRELLQKHREGLIALSGCLSGEVAKALVAGDEAGATRIAGEYRELMGADNYFLEIMDHGLPDQKTAARGLVALSRATGIPLVATNDGHYVRREDCVVQDVRLCISTNARLDDPKRMKFDNDQFYLKSPAEMHARFAELPDACSRTLAIAGRCHVTLPLGGKILLPDYDVPDGETLDSYLEKLCRDGLPHRYPAGPPREAEERITRELGIISRMGFSGYFLIVWDFIKYARSQGIPVGPGRGSGAGSLVTYLLGITNVDPLRYGLLFERFLNPDRKSMPDLDIDVSDTDRGRVIEYVRRKYGENAVAQAITFSTLEARAAVKDVGRAMGMPFAEVNRLSALIPHQPTDPVGLARAIRTVPELSRLAQASPATKQLLDMALRLEGIRRNTSVHAAAIVITPGNLTDHIPLSREKDVTTTQFAGEDLGELGLLKMDILGLRTLSVVQKVLRLIEDRLGAERARALALEDIPLDDAKTFQMLESRAIGVFQLDSSGMRDLLRKLRPTEIEDIIALISLYRPGPMKAGMVDKYIHRKHGREKVRYDHPLLEPILKTTYGTMVYQEQIMKIAMAVGGFTPGQADSLRKAMGKKRKEDMEKPRAAFLEGARKRAVTSKVAEHVFDEMFEFAGYGFNRSHAAAYGLLAYHTAYLKANFPVEYMTGLLSTVMDKTERMVTYLTETRDMGIPLLPPDIQRSRVEFTIEETAPGAFGIRFGLLAIKNVGQTAIESLIAAREAGGAFTSPEDFCSRVDTRLLNKRVVESLIKAGAMDAFGKRAALTARLDEALAFGQARQEERAAGQGALFGADPESPGHAPARARGEAPVREWPEHQILAGEKEVLGFYLSGHPLARWGEEMKVYARQTIGQALKLQEGASVRVGGIVTHMKKIKTKTGDLMAAFRLADLEGEIEIVVFPKTFAQVSRAIQVDRLVIVTGTLDTSRETTQIRADDVLEFYEARDRFIARVVLRVNTAGLEEETLVSLRDTMATYPGNCQVTFRCDVPGEGVRIVQAGMKVKLYDDLLLQFEKMLGKGAVEFVRDERPEGLLRRLPRTNGNGNGNGKHADEPIPF